MEVSAGVDKSRSTIAHEVALRKVRVAMEGVRPGLKLFMDKASFAVTYRWTPLVQVRCSPTAPTELQWNLAGLSQHGFSAADFKPAATAAIQEIAVQWSG